MSPNAAEGRERLGLKDLGALVQQSAQNSAKEPQNASKPGIILPDTGNQAVQKAQKPAEASRNAKKRGFNKNRNHTAPDHKNAQNGPGNASQHNSSNTSNTEITIKH